MKTLNYREYAKQVVTPSPVETGPGTVVVSTLATVKNPGLPACLVCVVPQGQLVGRLYELSPLPLVLGREGCDIVIPERTVSRAHARLTPRPDGSCLLTDLGSSNGTFVNGHRVESQVIRCGDRVHLGHVLLYLTDDGV